MPKHTSVLKLSSPIEFIESSRISPFCSKVQIKVCYVGDEPNRNRSVITKEVATEMAPTLRGCPIVGFYNENKKDFEEHNQQINISNGEWKITDTTVPYGFVDLNAALEYYYNTFITETDEPNTLYWNRAVFEDPASLRFWFDFINGKGSELDKYSVKAIGDRTKVVNSDDIKAIYYGEIPNLIYISQEDYNLLVESNTVNDGYVYVILPESLSDYFVISKKNKSAQDELDTLLYNYAYCNESISITTIPIYHLEPNTKIQVFDEKTKINGEYVINKINVPLNYNGTMSVSATRAPIRLY